MGRIAHRNLDAPDEVLEFSHLRVNLVRVGSLTIGRGTVEPGFRWSTHDDDALHFESKGEQERKGCPPRSGCSRWSSDRARV